MALLIGCSGWSYDDWIGRFYPSELAKQRGDWFGYYARYFSTVEINSTFYRVPTEAMVRAWIQKAEDLPGFQFSVKVPRLITHEMLVRGELETAAEQAVSFEGLCLRPLGEAGLLGAVLLQLSPSVRHDSGDGLHRLRTLLERLSVDTFQYAVEFRHASWLIEKHNELRPDALELLQAFKIANVILDGPGFPPTRSLTARHAYLRFHGRNYDLWYGADEKEDDYRINRYDYLYAEDQLRKWLPRLEEIRENSDIARIYFNNHGRAKAVKNAFQLMDLLAIPHAQKAVEIQDQLTLGGFDQSPH